MMAAPAGAYDAPTSEIEASVAAFLDDPRAESIITVQSDGRAAPEPPASPSPAASHPQHVPSSHRRWRSAPTCQICVSGVPGKRWRAWQDWRERYFNDACIDRLERYRPDEAEVCDSRAYW